MAFYGDGQRALQHRFDTDQLAAAFEATIINDEIDDEQREFIESRDFFFLSSVDADGWPTVSYKDGPVGMVTVVDERTVEFPSDDGNGMFLSMGNIEASAKVGMLFIDLETPRRLRLQATAEISDDAEALARWPGAQLVVRATIAHTFPNCARYIPPPSAVVCLEVRPRCRRGPTDACLEAHRHDPTRSLRGGPIANRSRGRNDHGRGVRRATRQRHQLTPGRPTRNNRTQLRVELDSIAPVPCPTAPISTVPSWQMETQRRSGGR